MTFSCQVEGFSSGRNQQLTRQLLRRRQEMNGLELLAIARHVDDTGQFPVFGKIFSDFRSLPTDHFWRVWTSPAAYLWTKLAYNAVRPSDHRSDMFFRHATWLGKGVEEFATDHMAQLAVFTTAAQLLQGSPYRAPCPVPVDPIGSFPGAGFSWQHEVPFSLLGCTADAEIIVQIDGMERAWRANSVPGMDSPFFKTPHAAGRGIIWIDGWDSCMRMNYAGMEWSPRVTDYVSIEAAADRVSGALTRIEAYSSGIAEEAGDVLVQGAPLQLGSDCSSPSGSVSFMPGAFYFADVKEDDRIAEMIIHELSHNKLNLLTDLDPLLDPEQHGDGWGDQSYYSPWRNDPRPLKGILHGLFVFVEVAAFWAHQIATSQRNDDRELVSSRRFKTVFAQVEVALEILSAKARLTEIGKSLLNDLRSRVQDMRSQANLIDGDSIPPLYAELQDDGRFSSLSVNEAVRLHREIYAVGPRG